MPKFPINSVVRVTEEGSRHMAARPGALAIVWGHEESAFQPDLVYPKIRWIDGSDPDTDLTRRQENGGYKEEYFELVGTLRPESMIEDTDHRRKVNEFLNTLVTFFKGKNSLQAIREVRTNTLMGLAEAKQFVDLMGFQPENSGMLVEPDFRLLTRDADHDDWHPTCITTTYGDTARMANQLLSQDVWSEKPPRDMMIVKVVAVSPAQPEEGRYFEP
jgi:hypothetical protein